MSNTRKRSHKHKRKLTVNRKNRKTRRVKRNPSRKHRSRRKFFGGVLTEEEKKKRFESLIDTNNTSKSRARKLAQKTADHVQNAKANVRNPIPTENIESLYDTNRKYMIQYVVDNPGVSTYEAFKNHVTKYLKKKRKPLPTNDYELNMLYEKTKAEKERNNHTPDKKYNNVIDTINNDLPKKEKLENVDKKELENIQSPVTDIQIEKENNKEKGIFKLILENRTPFTNKLNALRNDNTTYYTKEQQQILKNAKLHRAAQPNDHKAYSLTQQQLQKEKEKKKKEEEEEYLRRKEEFIEKYSKNKKKQNKLLVTPVYNNPQFRDSTTKTGPSDNQSSPSQYDIGGIIFDWLKLKAEQHNQTTDSTKTFLENAKKIDDTEENIQSLLQLMNKRGYDIEFSDINDINDINDNINEKTSQFKEVRNDITEFINQYDTTGENSQHSPVATIIDELLDSKTKPPMHFSS